MANNYQNAPEPVENFFRPVSIPRPNKRPKTKGEVKNDMNNKISLNSIVASVHRRLKPNKPPKVHHPSVPRPIAATSPTSNTSKYVSVADLTQACDISAQGLGPRPQQTVNFAESIPQIKANIAQKQQKRLYRCAAGSAYDENYTRMQRIREVQRQRKILSDMLNEHKKLQRDRMNIAVEIQSMKTHLNEIRDKLDNSLRRLNGAGAVISKNIPNVQYLNSQRRFYRNSAVRPRPSVKNRSGQSSINMKKPRTQNIIKRK